jgi:hypothetical protein
LPQEKVDNEICTFEYAKKEEASTAQTVDVQGTDFTNTLRS